MPSWRRAKAWKAKKAFRSGLEDKVATYLQTQKITFAYEPYSIPWTSRPKKHRYTPDFLVRTHSSNVIYLETKGLFDAADMEKHLMVKLQNPQLDIRFVFQRSAGWHTKVKTKSYAKWCQTHGFKYCDYKDFKETLKEWINE
jgi:hypothetical protein